MSTIRRLWGRLRGRRTLSGDWCATCQQDLAVGHVWEVRTGHEADEATGGGTFLAATYCRRHAPMDAKRIGR